MDKRYLKIFKESISNEIKKDKYNNLFTFEGTKDGKYTNGEDSLFAKKFKFVKDL